MEISVCRDSVLVIDIVNISVLFDSQLSLTFKCSFTDVITMPFYIIRSPSVLLCTTDFTFHHIFLTYHYYHRVKYSSSPPDF